MAKKVKKTTTKTDVDPNADEIGGVEVVDEAQAKEMVEKKKSNDDRSPRRARWDERELIQYPDDELKSEDNPDGKDPIPNPFEHDIETPNGGTATLVVEYRRGVNSRAPKVRFGRRGRTGQINSIEIWDQDMEVLIPMILKVRPHVHDFMLWEEEQIRQRNQDRWGGGLTANSLADAIKNL